jgi:hypothetical protein
MSIETMMTLGLAGLIFLLALVTLGVLTLVTRVAMLVLRPAARGGYSLARRHAPAISAGAIAVRDRAAAGAPVLRDRVAAALVMASAKIKSWWTTTVVPSVRSWFIGGQAMGSTILVPVRNRSRHP